MVPRGQLWKYLLTVLMLLVVVAITADTADAARKRKKAKRNHRPAVVQPYVEKFAAIVIEANTGRVLYERMSTETRYPASLTKMMTLYLLFEQVQKGNLTLSTPMTTSTYAASQDPTKLGLDPGEQITVEDAIKALVVRSANDVAVIAAEHLGGSEWAFATRMTQKAREMGMARTTFVNASGLPDENQRSTAADLVILSRRLVTDFPQFYPYFRLQSFYWGGRSYEGHNNLMKFFDGADGMKTGYTRMSGFNLASSATRQGTRLISVVMGGRSARDRDIQTAELLESEFTRLGLGRPAPVIMAMSPLVLDDEEAAAEAAESAAAFRPDAASQVVMAPPAPPQSGSPPTNGTAPVMASIPSSPREIGQGDTAEQVRSTPVTHSGKWGIQVGAHSTRDKAETQLSQVTAQQRDILGRAQSAIVQLDVRGETFYRVRFGAFTPAKAESLCKALQKRGTSCLVVTDGSWDQANTRASLPIAVR
jgi:D-alanyl-D-alanine carboxypeptidase